MEESDTPIQGQFSIKVRIGNAEIGVSAPEKDFVIDESNRLIALHFDSPRLRMVGANVRRPSHGRRLDVLTVPCGR